MPSSGTTAATSGTRPEPPGTAGLPPEARPPRLGGAGPVRWPRDHECWWLPGTPWWARAAGTPDGRGALEVYEGGELLDVVVDTPVAPRLLRGARRAGRGDEAVAVAWGRVILPGEDVVVRFTGGRLRRRPRATPVTVATPWCWIAVAEGSFTQVVATREGTRDRLALTRARVW